MRDRANTWWLATGQCLLLLMLGLPAPAAHAAASCGNPIACENQLPGTPQSLWDDGTDDQSILDGLLRQLTKKTVVETALDEEMAEHLGYDKHDPAGNNSGNSHNGIRTKTVLTDHAGPVPPPCRVDPGGRSGPTTTATTRPRPTQRGCGPADLGLNLDPPVLLGGSDGECSCDKQGWDCSRFSSDA